jgi:hypothetical protein
MDLHSLAGTAQRRVVRAAWLLAGCAALLACRATPGDPPAVDEARKSPAPLAAPPERLQLTLPAEFVPLELRGEGSETLRAPAGASARSMPGRVDVEAGAEFALEIEFQPQLSQLPTAADGARPVLLEGDLAVFESAGSYWFVMLRELVPEWDESERRRVACSSAGAARKGAASDHRRFPRAAVERMVAACRSLALPRLE